MPHLCHSDPGPAAERGRVMDRWARSMHSAPFVRLGQRGSIGRKVAPALIWRKGRVPKPGYIRKIRRAFSFRIRGLTASLMSSASKSASQRSGVIAGQSEPNSILSFRIVFA